MISRRESQFLLLSLCAALIVSAIHPYDFPTWILETFPVFIGIPLLMMTYKRFPLTSLTYRLLFLHALILILGAHYSYARVPLGFWMQDVFEFSRNNYDRIGHLAQGFIPAILAREILLRKTPLVVGGWLFFLVACVCLAFSAFYEFLEWWAAVIGGEGAHEFLGTQGDVWDTQWDMFLALTGAITAQVLLGRYHDKLLLVNSR